MAKLNYQKLSRETSLKRQPVLGDGKLSRKSDDLPVAMNGPNHILNFGKHKGTMIKDLPIQYIEWAILNINDSRVDMFIREIQRRNPFYLT
jgi:hypothetical protein